MKLGFFDIDWSQLVLPSISFPSEDEKEEVKSEGSFCVKCKEFSPFAEVNQDDGTFKCYSCRKYG